MEIRFGWFGWDRDRRKLHCAKKLNGKISTCEGGFTLKGICNSRVGNGSGGGSNPSPSYFSYSLHDLFGVILLMKIVVNYFNLGNFLTHPRSWVVT